MFFKLRFCIWNFLNNFVSNKIRFAEGQKFLSLAGIMQQKLMEKYSIDAKELKSGTFTFTFVRHPFQRIVSIN